MQRYFAETKIGDDITLSSLDEHHIKHVMRMQVGDLIEVVYDNKLYQSKIVSLDKISIKVISEIPSPKIKGPQIVLIIPALKEQKMDFILQKGTELGVDAFYVIPFRRSIITLDERKAKVKLERWQKICKEASEQSKRIDIPLISVEKDIHFTKSMVGLKLICSTIEKENFLKSSLKKAHSYDKIILVIGPEGGITEEEEIALEEIGFKKISLGSQIMRVETVPLFLASAIKYEFME